MIVVMIIPIGPLALLFATLPASAQTVSARVQGPSRIVGASGAQAAASRPSIGPVQVSLLRTDPVELWISAPYARSMDGVVAEIEVVVGGDIRDGKRLAEPVSMVPLRISAPRDLSKTILPSGGYSAADYAPYAARAQALERRVRRLYRSASVELIRADPPELYIRVPRAMNMDAVINRLDGILGKDGKRLSFDGTDVRLSVPHDRLGPATHPIGTYAEADYAVYERLARRLQRRINSGR